jgi:hypothetical protein
MPSHLHPLDVGRAGFGNGSRRRGGVNLQGLMMETDNSHPAGEPVPKCTWILEERGCGSNCLYTERKKIKIKIK